ncbi:aminotransferase [Citromicrobium sp. RCC1885]|uniref:cysteine desulfurase family protein n=1 Tax=unclassified Citromicrobium TaxID=2630544 RepID=UPI0006C90916|nr:MULTISPECIES: aminotransferase class V-fold PLP-dependent enzyme [unclassified Citromicrobium]KPM23175.1 aminotransferase [Citromicrobium sp. RCC1885]KPM26582.1 aminotransferase [Citromicrobium sp. RCC1878]MAO05681.1 aminotransferase class V-fold PLP-dependent enzyme [Citromicrobium sp.]OAM08902.1 aminotransferase [Citromicrobium sp. RCC1897]|tara:strand:+ start:24274 stop:25359 length:1086 start_codon:yes stop_codon:yes gene_type:complete
MIYLDYQATTPLAPEAREAMLAWLGGPDSDTFGNPHSPHRMGRMAAAAVEVAREQVAQLFPPGGQVIFTGSATEAINLAIRGNAAVRSGEHIAFSAIEHAAVIDTVKAIGNWTELPVGADGVIAPDVDMPKYVGLLAVMQVNNEIGTIQPIAGMAKRAEETGALLLVDGVQAAGKMALPQEADMIAVSAHKLHGPKGIGALWVRDGLSLIPHVEGGGQEQGLRSGTLSPALCAGFGAAAALAVERQEEDAAHVEELWHIARDAFSGWTLNGSAEQRWHGNLNIRKDGLDVARLMSECREVMFSAGSACASGSGRTSHVLRAIGLSDVQAKSSIRLGWGRYTTREDIERGCSLIIQAAESQA